MPLKTRLEHSRIAIIGLGYVGLPLAVEFGKQYDTVGFDINAARIAELRQGRDSTLEVEPELLAQSARLRYADTLGDIATCNVYIVTVPTPVDAQTHPDLRPLHGACALLATPHNDYGGAHRAPMRSPHPARHRATGTGHA